MYYLIRRNDGKFVALSNSKSSYTRDILRARTYRTREIAEQDLCPENESVVSLDGLLHGRQ